MESWLVGEVASQIGEDAQVQLYIEEDQFTEQSQYRELVNTGLIKAVDGNHLPVVRLLVNKFGRDIVNRNSMRRELGAHNAITMAALSKHAQEQMLEYLLRACGGNPNAYEPVNRKSALHLATSPVFSAIKVALLAEWGADVSATDKAGCGSPSRSDTGPGREHTAGRSYEWI